MAEGRRVAGAGRGGAASVCTGGGAILMDRIFPVVKGEHKHIRTH